MKMTETIHVHRRHLIVLKQLALIMLFFIISSASVVLVGNETGVSAWISYFYYVNHVVNFVIYLAVNKEFRKEAKNMINVITKKVLPSNTTPIFTLK